MTLRRPTSTWAFSIVLALGTCGHAAVPAGKEKTALDEYILKPDPTYSWKLLEAIPADGYTTFIIDLKSQTWRAVPEVDRPVWQHWLVIVKPTTVEHDTAFLWINGGKNDGQAPHKPNPEMVRIALATHSVVADLRMIPNQPLIFNGDGQRRSEDDLIAYCWIKCMDTGDPTWLPRFPMVKSAVRAMDAATEFLAGTEGGKTPVNKFVVSGGSKRGWTTWLTGAVDKRVVAIIPIVIDVLNVKAAKMNHFASYGFWAEAVGDYTRHKVHERMETPEYAKVLKLVDPFSYKERLDMPKFVVNSSGDQYFPPDSSRFYFHDLSGKKYLRYVPNTKHNLQGSDARDSVLAFYQAILERSALPDFSWRLESDGAIRVRTANKPSAVYLWQATNPKARDFRLDSIGPAYKKSTLEPQGDGSYVGQVAKPAAGWTAFFVELVFPSGRPIPYKFSTQVQIVPETYPHSYEEFRRTLKAGAAGSAEK